MTQPFHARLLAARPDVAARQARNADRRKTAIAARDARDAAGLSEAQAAAAMGVSVAEIREMERLGE